MIVVFALAVPSTQAKNLGSTTFTSEGVGKKGSYHYYLGEKRSAFHVAATSHPSPPCIFSLPSRHPYLDNDGR